MSKIWSYVRRLNCILKRRSFCADILLENDGAAIEFFDKLVQIEPQIFEHILEFLDANALQSLRSVSKAWNDFASRILRRDVTVNVLVGGDDRISARLLKLLNDSKSFENHSLPFRSIRLHVQKWEDPSLDRILTDKRISVIEVCVRQDAAASGSYEKLSCILSNHGAKLQKLGLNVGIDPDKLNENFAIRLPLLEVIFMVDSNLPEKYSDFIIRLTHAAPNLRVLWIFGHDINFVRRILAEGRLYGLQELADLCMQSVACADFFPEKNCPNLKKLTAIDSVNDANGWKPINLVKMYSSLIEELQIFWSSQISQVQPVDFPYCQKLERLYIRRWPAGLDAFNKIRLPKLKELIIFDEILSTDDPALTNPHDGLETFVLETYKREPERHHSPQRFREILQHVAIQFPCISSLELFWKIKSEYVHVLVKSFPNLQNLFFYAIQGYSASIFTGIEDDDLEVYLAQHMTLHEVERMPCLMDLHHLKHLTLLEGSVQGPTLTPNCFIHGIRHMPNLHLLTFHWHSRNLEPTIAQSLSHVQKIQILTPKELWEYRIARQQQRLCSYMSRPSP